MVKMGTVWDRTAEFLSDNVGAVLPIALLTFFVPASIENSLEAAITGADTGLALGLRLLQLALAVVSLWGTLAITAMALDLVSDRTPGSIATRRLVPALVVSVLMIVGAAVLVMPMPAILMANGYDLATIARGEEVAISPSVGGLVALYGLVLLFVLLWLVARLIVTTPAIVREDRMLSAIAQSWALTRGMALRIVGVILLFAIVSWVAQLAARTVFGSIFALVAGGDGEGVTLASILTSIVAGAVQSAFMVIPPVFTAKLYLALAARDGLRQGAAA